MSNELTTTKSVELFKGLFEKGIQKIQEACEVYVTAIDKDDGAKEKFRESLPHIPVGAWVKFEKVGRKLMLPRLMFDTTPMAERLKKMPISTQRQVYGKNIPMVTKDGDILKVDFFGATQEQAKQILSIDHVRTPAEQRAWLISRPKLPDVTRQKCYEVKNGKLCILRACSFDKDELIQILAEI